MSSAAKLGFYLRWLLFALSLSFLAASLYSVRWWTVAGFLACGGLWCCLSLRKALELDSPRPK